MKRWAIARMVNYGDFIAPAFEAHQPINYRVWSKPGVAWCLGQLAAADLTAISADPDVFILPDATLDAPFSQFSAGVRNNVRNKLSAAGFTTADIQNSWTIRQILVYVLQQIQPALDSVEQGDVQDLF